jgi:hypothetical protein
MLKKDLKEKIFVVFLFTLFGLVALQIPFTVIIGSGSKFTLFDFFAPSSGAFLGTLPGIISVFIMQLINFLIHGKSAFDTASVIRLFPTLFAVFYFSKKRPSNLLIPILCMIAFLLHPVGRAAWQYSLFWLIPIAAHFGRKILFVRSLGATFTAHAVGGALWIWAFGLTPQIWLALIPQVIMERTLFATGISVFYIVANNLLFFLSKNKLFPQSLPLKQGYLFKLRKSPN